MQDIEEEVAPDTRGRKRIHSTTVGRIERLHDPPTLVGLRTSHLHVFGWTTNMFHECASRKRFEGFGKNQDFT